MIPILVVPILNQPEFLYRMLASLDHPVERVVVIDNGGLFANSILPDGGEARLMQARSGCISAVEILSQPHNLGVAASWNLAMHEFSADWWMFSGFDIEYAPGDLDRLVDHMETVGGIGLLGGYFSYAMDRATVERAGFFDENFHPAYFEDNDYDYRALLTGVPINGLPADLAHHGSATIRGNRSYEHQNNRTFPLNADYYVRKWGGMPKQERFTSPFDLGGDIRDWTLDADRVVNLRWETSV